MAIAKGDSLGPYEILGHLGSGGMGEVWRARDRRIRRDVAVKVLAGAFHESDARLQRFEQEARAAGALNHPGLVTIFDVGTTGGSPYIVMELLEGQTLRAAIGDPEPAPMPVRRAIEYGVQIASALAAAHEKGIIHRDLKPENIFITSDRRVKILDFGLAKLAHEPREAGEGDLPVRHLTSAGVTVGTPSYMSPEQARGLRVDHRTDIFAFGSLLYEMLTGKPAFERPSGAETMYAVLAEEPPALDPDIVSPALAAVVAHCLEKDPVERFQSARDLAFQLRMLPEAQRRTTDQRLALPARRRLPYAALAALALLALLAAGAGTFLYLRSRVVPRATRSTFRQLTFADGAEIFPTLAPDGKSFAYVSAQAGNRDIYVQRVDGRATMNLTADSPEDDSQPAFSPDGAQIAFRSEREGGGIFVMAVTGESPRRLTDFGHNPSWSPDGARIVVSTRPTEMKPRIHMDSGELWIIESRTGAKRALRNNGPGGTGSGSDALQPAWSPHGKRIAFWGMHTDSLRREIWTIDPDAPDPPATVVRAVSATRAPGAQWNPVWSPDGRFLYFGSDRDGTLNLWRIAIDEETGATDGLEEPVPLPAVISGHYSFSKQGEMVYTTMTRSHFVLAMPFNTQTAAIGAPRVIFGGSEEILCVASSPDRRMIAFTTGSDEHLFLVDADGTRLRQLTNDTAKDRCPAWSPDGKILYWFSNRSGSSHIWSMHTDGSGFTRVTDEGDLRRGGVHHVYLPQVSPDGKILAVETGPARAALVHLDRPPGQRLEILARDIGRPHWSPDGRSLLGVPLNANGGYRPGMVVHSLETRRTTQVLDRGVPHWLPDGKRVAFLQNDRSGIVDLSTGRIITHPVTPPPGVQLEAPFGGPMLSLDGSTVYVSQTLERSDIWLVRP